MAVIASDPIVIATAPETEPNTPPYSLSAPILTSLPGDGFAVAWSLHNPPIGAQSAESATFISFYDSDADQTTDPVIELPGGALGNIAASTAGTVALMTGFGASTVNVQVFDLNGNPIADEQPIFDPGSDTFVALPINLAATADGGYAAVWRWFDNDAHAPEWVSQLRLILSGEAASTATDIGEDARSTVHAAVAAEGEIKVLATIEIGDTSQVALFRFSEEGVLLAEPEPLETEEGLPLFDAYLPYGHAFTRLANGDLLATGAEPWTSPVPQPTPPQVFAQRLDGDGEPLSAKVFTGSLITENTQLAPLQDGGYVAAWAGRIDGLDSRQIITFEVFDRDDVAVASGTVADESGTGWFDIAALDDGRFVITYEHETDVEDAVPAISAQVFDYEPSRTATLGGTIATVDSWQDQISIDRDDGIDTLVTSDSLALLPFIPNLTFAGTADLNADGNDMTNFLIGNDGNNILVGYLGNDVMHGHGGDDFLAMGRGNDVADTGDGQNTVWGGQGDDSIQGGAGDDILNGDRHDDVIDGGAGDDSVNGGGHDDLLTGNDGDDSITGGAGADTLEGWDGADTLRGDRDDDQLEGGDGADRFVFAHFFGNDTIRDFHWAEDGAASDRIVFELDEDGTINGVLIEDAAEILDLAEDTDDGLLIAVGTGHSILLEGVEKADLAKDAFALVVV